MRITMPASGWGGELAAYLARYRGYGLTEVIAATDTEVHSFSSMPKYRVSIVNEHFSQDGEEEAPDVVTAWQSAIASAIRIAGDQVSHGNPFFGAEVRLLQGNKQIGRYVVSVGATPLKE